MPEEYIDLSDDPEVNEQRRLPNEEYLSVLDEEEMGSLVRIQGLDKVSVQKLVGTNKGRLFGQSLADGIIQEFVDTPATTAILMGRRWDENGEQLVKAGEEVRNWGIALRSKLGLTPENAEVPISFADQVVAGFGNVGGSLLGMMLANIAGTAAGGAVATAVAGPEATPFGAAVGGISLTYLTSYYSEKAMMAQELMDAGFSAEWTDKMSDIYAIPVAALDSYSFKVMGKLLAPVATNAVKGSVGKLLLNLTKSTAEGLITEGTTEALQNRYQTEMEIGLKLRSRDFINDAMSDVVSFIVGGTIGGMSGTVGQLKYRNSLIDKTKQLTDLPRKDIARMVDDALHEANRKGYEVLGNYFDATEHVKWVEKAFDKIQKGTPLPNIEMAVEPTVPENIQAYQELYQGLQVDEKAKAIPQELERAYTERFQARDAEPAVRDEAAKNLMQTKGKYQEFINSNPFLKQLSERLDTLQFQWEQATPEEQGRIEEEMQAISFRMRNPGEVTEIIGAAEEAVNAKQAEATKILEQLQMPEEMRTGDVSEEQFVKATNEYLAAERQFQAYQALSNRVQYGEQMSVARVRQEARKNLSQIVEAFKLGKRASEADIKNIQKNFRILLAGQKLSGKAAARLLRSVLTIRSEAQFNDRAGAIIDNVNEVIRTEKVQDLQELGLRVIKKMLPTQEKGNVSPENQLLSEHLNRVLRAKADLVYQTDTAKPEYRDIEAAVYDLANAGADEKQAARAFQTLSDYYKNGLSEYQGFKEAQKQAEVEIADQVVKNILKDVPYDNLKAAYDSVRQKDNRKSQFTMTPINASMMAIFDILDAPEKKPLGEGTLGKAFNVDTPYLALRTYQGQVREKLDAKLYEIYGKDAQRVWLDERKTDFLNVKFNDREINITRPAAMSLYLMTQMPGVYNDLLRQNINQQWLEAFRNGENVGFMKQDYAFMSSMRELLDWFADELAPVVERLTHRPFRRVDAYFMTQRFFVESLADTGYTENNNVIDSMLNGDFSKLNPADIDSLKSRVKSEKAYEIPDIFEAVSYYAADMNHFLAYAEYANRMRNIFTNSEVRKVMAERMPEAYLQAIDRHTERIIKGTRDSDRKAMKLFYKVIGTYAANQVMRPKAWLRQLSGVLASLDLEGVNPAVLLKTMLDLPNAIKSGEVDAFMGTQVMKERYQDAFDMAVLFSRDLQKLGKIEGSLSKKLHDVFRIFVKHGDQTASTVVGLMVYRHQLQKTGDATQASIEAIKAIESTQQSMNQGRLPDMYNRSDILSMLVTKFQRTPGQFLDNYLRAWRGVQSGQVPVKQWLRTMITYHVWVPLFETLITAGRFERDETLINMALGPLAYMMIIGNAVQAAASSLYELAIQGKADLPAYMKDVAGGTIADSLYRTIIGAGKSTAKAIPEILRLFDYPDYETMWTAVKDVSHAAEAVVPYPTYWMAQSTEAIYELFQNNFDDILTQAKRFVGYPESRLKD